MRRVLPTLLAAAALGTSSCGWDGNFTLFGYTTRPNYDCNIHTVRVPIFKNNTMYRGVEFDLTRAVIREIEAKTPFKVVGMGCAADTELAGTVINLTKNVVNNNQLNEVRQAETMLAVELYWRDLRTGEILSKPKKGPGAPPNLNLPPGAPQPPPPVVLVQSLGDFVPELGQSLTTALQKNIDRLATQIVSMMEIPW